MAYYKHDGKDNLFDGCEQGSSSDVRYTSPIQEKYLIGGQTFQQKYGRKLISYVAGYEYSRINGGPGGYTNYGEDHYYVGGASGRVSRLACRPLPTAVYTGTTAGDYYIYRYGDNVLISQTLDSPSGTLIHKCPYKWQSYILIATQGAGGGGGGSNPDSGGGGGAGGYSLHCVWLYETDTYYRIRVGTGGAGGRTYDSNNVNGQYGVATNINSMTRNGKETGGCGASAGGYAQGSSKGNGARAATGGGGSPCAWIAGFSGGDGGNGRIGGGSGGGGGGFSAVTLPAYNPEGVTFSLSATGGGSGGSYGGGGGSSPFGQGGRGANGVEDGSNGGCGAGGGGGSWMFIGWKRGGKGGDGRFTIYY